LAAHPPNNFDDILNLLKLQRRRVTIPPTSRRDMKRHGHHKIAFSVNVLSHPFNCRLRDDGCPVVAASG
jgi:hypothetical protein